MDAAVSIAGQDFTGRMSAFGDMGSLPLPPPWWPRSHQHIAGLARREVRGQ
jgi:hypothetical protein